VSWLVDFDEAKKKAEESDQFISRFLNACKDKEKLDEWKLQNSDKEKEKDTFRFWF
jgi:hypothetical protein